MPGTGHSARYKGSISNRVKKSPFQQLAEWNAQLLGADGAVPTITGGGGGLAFKKLDASDIDGVMHNPATEDLDMHGHNILTSTGDLGLIWKDDGQAHNIRIGGLCNTSGTRQVLIMADGSGTRVTIGSSTLDECHLIGEVMTLSGTTIAIGTGANTNVTMGNTSGDTVTTIKGGGAGAGTGSVNVGNTIAETVNIGHSGGQLGFFSTTAIDRPQCNFLVSSTEGTGTVANSNQVINRINYIIRIMDEGGAGGPLPGGMGLFHNGGGHYDNDSGSSPP